MLYLCLSNKEKDMKTTTTKIQAEFIMELMNQGMSFELALEKSFDKVNEFLNSMIGNEFFNSVCFDKTKEIINGTN